jgi:mono/diheme cytochrome c family protein
MTDGLRCLSRIRVALIGLAGVALLAIAAFRASPPSLAVTVLAAQKPAPASAAATTYKDVYEGWKWWHVYCYRCHGVNAIGGALAPNLISPTQKQDPAAFLKIVRNGKKDTAMQAWAPLLTNKQIGQIHLYVRARADKVLPPGRPDEVGPKKGKWEPPPGWPK